MALSSAVIDALVAAGCTVEQLAAAMKADMAEGEARLTEKREKDAERQRRSRASRAVTVTPCDTADTPPLDKETPQTPKKLNPPAHIHETGARKAWACPAGVEQPHWADFLANRRSKRLTNTPTAYAGQLKALANLSDDEWPPGRLVQFAAERGWASINDPRTSPYATGTGNGRSGNLSLARNRADEPSRTLGAGADFLAARRVAAH